MCVIMRTKGPMIRLGYIYNSPLKRTEEDTPDRDTDWGMGSVCEQRSGGAGTGELMCNDSDLFDFPTLWFTA